MYEHKVWTIGSLLRRLQGSTVDFPDYQRHFVWNRRKQAGLIGSVGRDVPIGTIVLVKHADNSYDVADGRQRATTLLMFQSDKLVYGPRMGSRKHQSAICCA